MRPLAFALAVVVSAVPPVQAQQLALPAPVEQRDSRVAEVLVQLAQPEFPSPGAEVLPAEAYLADEESSAVRQASARNFLAVIGAVVLIAALISLFR
jgi:hypothetical protein